MAGKRNRDVPYRDWKALPPRAAAWSALSGYERAMGTELFRVFGEDEAPVVAEDWKVTIARRLELDGKERPPLYRALDAMVAAGLLLVVSGSIRLLYSDDALAVRRRHIATTPDSGRGQVGTTSAVPRTQVGVTSTALRTQVEGTSGSQHGLTGGNRSGPLAEIDREIDREKERENARPREAEKFNPSADSAIAMLRGQIRLDYEQRLFARTTALPPKTPAVEQALSAVTRWVWETAEARGEQPFPLASRLLEAFFASARAREGGFKVTWLASDPMEFLAPAGERRAPNDRRQASGPRGMSDVSAPDEQGAEGEPEFMHDA